MNIQHVFEDLEFATDFELFRLKTAIEKVLEDPERTKTLKSKIQIGMKVEYFCTERNKAIPCTVLQVRRSRVAVQEQDTGKQWTLPFYFLNLGSVETTLVSHKSAGLSKAELAIGDTVGFLNSKDNQEHIGQVAKLNPKRAVILVGNTAWTVPYAMLFPVLTSEVENLKQTLLLADRD